MLSHRLVYKVSRGQNNKENYKKGLLQYVALVKYKYISVNLMEFMQLQQNQIQLNLPKYVPS